jgi:hypothetical protein
MSMMESTSSSKGTISDKRVVAALVASVTGSGRDALFCLPMPTAGYLPKPKKGFFLCAHLQPMSYVQTTSSSPFLGVTVTLPTYRPTYLPVTLPIYLVVAVLTSMRVSYRAHFSQRLSHRHVSHRRASLIGHIIDVPLTGAIS